MFEGIAKRKLEKYVARQLKEKGAAWCLSYRQVESELLQNHPTQKGNVEALYQMLVTGGFDYLAAFRNPTADDRIDRVVEKFCQQTRQTQGPHTARFGALCWAKALACLSCEQRAEILECRKYLIWCWQVAFTKETTAIETEAKNMKQRAISTAQAAGRAEANRRIAADPEWGFSKSTRKSESDNEVFGIAGRMNEAFEEHDRQLKRKKEQGLAEQRKAHEQWVNATVRSAKHTDVSVTVSNEVWRRIQLAPDFTALRSKLEEVGQKQARIVAEQQRVEQQRQQKLQDEANERQRVETAKNNQLKAQAAERQRIETAKRNALQAEENKRLAPIRAAENERRKQQQAVKNKRLKIQKHRQNFPLQCVGFSDEEIWEQIKGS